MSTTTATFPTTAPRPTTAADDDETERAGTAARRWTLGLSLLHAVLAGGAFAVLGAVFDFPAILRRPAAEALAAFNDEPGTIRAAYYAFAWSSLLLIPLAVLLRRSLGERGRDGGLLAVAAALGLAAGLTQVLGFIRWTIVVPFLADSYADPATSAAGREAVAVVYEFANRYLGMSIGEHLGWVFQGTWVLLLGVALLRRGEGLRWLGAAGLLIAAALLVSSLEQFQFGYEGALGTLNAVGTTAFPFWQIALAAALLRGRPAAGR